MKPVHLYVSVLPEPYLKTMIKSCIKASVIHCHKQNILLSILFIWLSQTLSAQIPDSIRISDKNPEKLLKNVRFKEIVQDGLNIWQDDFTGHFAGIDFGLNFLNEKEPGFPDYDIIRSNSLYINFVQQSMGIQRSRNTIGIVTGLGLQMKSYRLDKNTTLQKESSGQVTLQSLFFDSNQKSKFSMVYATIPLLIEFQIPVNHYANRIYLSAGTFAGYRISSHTKIKYRVDRKREKLKTPGDFSLNDFRYGLMARAGYRRLQFLGNYDLQPMFSKEAGMPDINPITVGITILSL